MIDHRWVERAPLVTSTFEWRSRICTRCDEYQTWDEFGDLQHW